MKSILLLKGWIILEENRYLNYQSMVTTVATGMARLDNICHKINMDLQAETLKKSNTKLIEHTFQTRQKMRVQGLLARVARISPTR